jgi:uncharacterized protein YukJ
MALSYGFIKCKLKSASVLKASRHRREIQYHIHTTLQSDDGDWDSAINVGTNDSDDLLRYKLVYDYHNPLIDELKQAAPGFKDLTRTQDLPALDFLRSDILDETGDWRDSDVMDGSELVEPVASLLRLFQKARAQNADVYIFGRTYVTGGSGVHDVHMNQGSTGSFVNNGVDDHNDHNDIWQDGAVLVDLGQPEWAGYFTAFTQQLVPTDDLGNPKKGGHSI